MIPSIHIKNHRCDKMEHKKYIAVAGILVIILLVFLFLDNVPQEIKNYPLSGDTIVAFGDSLVIGVGSSREGGFVTLLAERIQKPIINLGKAGDTTKDALGRIGEVVAENPDVVLILLGGNDALQRIPLEETIQNLETIIIMLQEQGAAIVLLGVQGALIRDRFGDDFRKLAREHGALYVPNVLEDVYRNPQRMFDAIHPNDEGYRIIAERVYPVLVNVLSGTL